MGRKAGLAGRGPGKGRGLRCESQSCSMQASGGGGGSLGRQEGAPVGLSCGEGLAQTVGGLRGPPGPCTVHPHSLVFLWRNRPCAESAVSPATALQGLHCRPGLPRLRVGGLGPKSQA